MVKKIYYQVWLDTREITAEKGNFKQLVSKITTKKLSDINADDIKVYDGITGEDVTANSTSKLKNGVISASSKARLD